MKKRYCPKCYSLHLIYEDQNPLENCKHCQAPLEVVTTELVKIDRFIDVLGVPKGGDSK